MPTATSTMPGLVQAGHHPGRLASAGPSEEAGVPTPGRNGIPSGETR